MKKLFKLLKFDDKGLIPAVIQDARTKRVLTLCYMSREAFTISLKSGLVYVFRRSQGKLMMKGARSGCVQRIKRVSIDCEGKSLLFTVDQVKAACHEGYFTCYFRYLDKRMSVKVSGKRMFDPDKVYK
ncbi:phosphoribosyl-AMP cyclohydrolase [Candidatus Omnitrophota bacterium]